MGNIVRGRIWDYALVLIVFIIQFSMLGYRHQEDWDFSPEGDRKYGGSSSGDGIGGIIFLGIVVFGGWAMMYDKFREAARDQKPVEDLGFLVILLIPLTLLELLFIFMKLSP
jgi:hypothetical protein